MQAAKDAYRAGAPTERTPFVLSKFTIIYRDLLSLIRARPLGTHFFKEGGTSQAPCREIPPSRQPPAKRRPPSHLREPEGRTSCGI
jgi:hypothetical protein